MSSAAVRKQLGVGFWLSPLLACPPRRVVFLTSTAPVPTCLTRYLRPPRHGTPTSSSLPRGYEKLAGHAAVAHEQTEALRQQFKQQFKTDPFEAAERQERAAQRRLLLKQMRDQAPPQPAVAAPAPAPLAAPAPAASAWGAAPAAPGAFGAAPAPATASAFGGAFGKAPAPATGGLFGSTPAPAPAATGFGFGTPAAAPAPATTGTLPITR